MTLGIRLKQYLGERDQKSVAMGWIGRMTERPEEKALSSNTVPSRLSQLFADDPEGVRTFFKSPWRATWLFDELGVPDAERDGLRALAESTLAGGPAPRLVIDLSDQGDTPTDVIFRALREQFLGEGAIFPLAIVLTDKQYEYFPRSFDTLREKLRVEHVPNAEVGARTALALAGDSTPLVSARPLVPTSRWWALSFKGTDVALDPVDGLALLRREGRFTEPVLEHPLEALGGTAEAVTVPAGGVERRQLIAELAREDSPASLRTAGWRLGAAGALGAMATSRGGERLEHQIAGIVATLPVEVETAKPARLAEVLARATRRPLGPTALRVGDTIHLINPDVPVEGGPNLQVHDVRCAVPALTRLEQSLATWTEDDYLEDPLLGRVVHELANGDEAELKLLFHARAVLLLGAHLRPAGRSLLLGPRLRPARPEMMDDPLAALREIVLEDPPEALVRVRTEGPDVKYGVAVGYRDENTLPMAPFAYPGGRTGYQLVSDVRVLAQVPPLGDVLWEREDGELHGFIPNDTQSADGDAGVRLDPRANAAQWLDDVDASSWLAGKGQGRNCRYFSAPSQAWTEVEIAPPERVWEDADTSLALAWWALREALANPRSIRLPNGAMLLAVGGGLAARVHVREHGDVEDAVRGAVRCRVIARRDDRGRWTWAIGELAQPVLTHLATTSGYTSRIGVLMPSLWLAGKGFAADVSFLPAAMLPGESRTPAFGAAGVVGAPGVVGGLVANVEAADSARRASEEEEAYDDD